MNYFESKEDYLERILMLSEKNNLVRAIDIATSMNFSKPSVSIALKKLKADCQQDCQMLFLYIPLYICLDFVDIFC